MTQSISDPVLAYIAYGLMSSTSDYVKNVISQFYTPDEVILTRDVLWMEADSTILKEKIKRKNIKSDKKADKGFFLTIDDIVESIVNLDNAEKMPCFNVPFNLLHRIPLAMPSETSNIALVERLKKLEARVSTNETLLMKGPNTHPTVPTYANKVCTEIKNTSNNNNNPTPSNLASQRRPSISRSANDLRRKSIPNNQPSREPLENDGFQIQKTKRRPKRLVTGTKVGSLLAGAPEPSRDFFLHRLSKDTESTAVEQYINLCLLTTSNIGRWRKYRMLKLSLRVFGLK